MGDSIQSCLIGLQREGPHRVGPRILLKEHRHSVGLSPIAPRSLAWLVACIHKDFLMSIETVRHCKPCQVTATT